MNNKIDIIKSILFSKLSNKIYKLNFAVTSMCNSRCKTCNVWKFFLKNPRINKADLSLPEIEELFKKTPKSLVWLSLSGGEPFLRNDLDKICRAAIFNIPNLKVISIPSNGLLTNKVISKTRSILSLPIKNLFINLSLDGPSKIHNKIRGKKGSFEKTWKTYLKLLELSRRDSRLHINVETTISNYNVDYLENFISRLVKGGHKITITIAHNGFLYKNSGLKNNFKNINNRQDKIERIIFLISNNLPITSPLGYIQKIYLKNIKYYLNAKKQPLPCVALKNTISLDSQGNITPCFMWGKVLGNVRNFDLSLNHLLMKNHKNINAVRSQIIQQKCPNCWTPCEAYQAIISEYLIPSLSLIKKSFSLF